VLSSCQRSHFSSPPCSDGAADGARTPPRRQAVLHWAGTRSSGAQAAPRIPGTWDTSASQVAQVVGTSTQQRKRDSEGDTTQSLKRHADPEQSNRGACQETRHAACCSPWGICAWLMPSLVWCSILLVHLYRERAPRWGGPSWWGIPDRSGDAGPGCHARAGGVLCRSAAACIQTSL